MSDDHLYLDFVKRKRLDNSLKLCCNSGEV